MRNISARVTLVVFTLGLIFVDFTRSEAIVSTHGEGIVKGWTDPPTDELVNVLMPPGGEICHEVINIKTTSGEVIEQVCGPLMAPLLGKFMPVRDNIYFGRRLEKCEREDFSA